MRPFDEIRFMSDNEYIKYLKANKNKDKKDIEILEELIKRKNS